MRIGELAEKARTRPSTLRYYEERGLLQPPERTPAGYRSYGDETVQRLAVPLHPQSDICALHGCKRFKSLRLRCDRLWNTAFGLLVGSVVETLWNISAGGSLSLCASQNRVGGGTHDEAHNRRAENRSGPGVDRAAKDDRRREARSRSALPFPTRDRGQVRREPSLGARSDLRAVGGPDWCRSSMAGACSFARAANNSVRKDPRTGPSTGRWLCAMPIRSVRSSSRSPSMSRRRCCTRSFRTAEANLERTQAALEAGAMWLCQPNSIGR